jgi:hypothetical protein
MSMERRMTPRLKLDEPLQVTVLGQGLPSVTASVVEISGRGLKLHSPVPIPVDAPVKVEAPELLVLGEVCFCQAAGESYEIGMNVVHSLTNLSELERLGRALLDEQPATTRTERIASRY